MEILNATKLHQQTGASYALIRKLTSLGIITPINSSEPFLFSEDAVRQIGEYREDSKKSDIPLYPLLKSLEERFDKFETTLQEILNRLNTPQATQVQNYAAPKRPGRPKEELDPEKERLDKLKKEFEELKTFKNGKVMVDGFGIHTNSYYKTYDTVLRLLEIHEELTGDTSIREKMEERSKTLLDLVPEYKRLEKEVEVVGNRIEFFGFINEKVQPAKQSWRVAFTTPLGITKPKDVEHLNKCFESPFELAIGGRIYTDTL